MIRVLLIVFLATVGPSSLAQLLPERSALRNMRNHKWQRVNDQIQLALHKDSVNATAKYVYALYFLSSANPYYNIDSAHYYAMKANQNFINLNPKQRAKMKHFPLDSTILVKLQEQIDSLAFERAKALSTEKDYLHFLFQFPYAKQHTKALGLRNEAAFKEALKQNTYQSFMFFLQKYPLSDQAQEAQKKYDRLIFDQKTKDKKIASYESFLQEYPITPYRKEVEKNIFEIMTADGSSSSFEFYIKKYPNSFFLKKAKDILFHIFLEDDHHDLPECIQNDSMKNIQLLSKTYLIPFIKDGKFSFMDNQGTEIIQTDYSEINEEYQCGNITTDILIFPNDIVTKNGKIIFKGKVDEVEDIGYGFLKIKSEGEIIILHKTGFKIEEKSIQNTKLINGKVIAIQHENLWAIWTITGRKLTAYEWDDITNIGDVVIFKKLQKFKLVTMIQIAQLADQRSLKTMDLFDDVRSISNNLIWARTGDYEGVLDQTLNYHILFENHTLTSTTWGIIGSSSSGKKIYNPKGNISGFFDDVKTNELWVAVKNVSTWRLFNTEDRQFISLDFDSVNFLGNFAVGYSTDTLSVFLQSHLKLKFRNVQLASISAKDSTSFLLVNKGERKTIYDIQGSELFTSTFDNVQYAGNGIFIISKKEKKGLVNSKGKVLLPLDYDAIGGVNNQTISLLKNMKFGLYHTVLKRLIKPIYDRNLNRYNEKILIGYKDGFYGFINWNDKPIGKFKFEEVAFWNDTTALVKSNSKWMLYNIVSQKILLEDIQDYKLVSEIKGEKIFIIKQYDNYGVISNIKGIIIPINFSNIKNLGSAEEPLYFTEKHVEEAFIFVVIYYNKEGNLLRRQVFEEDDYEKIYCSD